MCVCMCVCVCVCVCVCACARDQDYECGHTVRCKVWYVWRIFEYVGWMGQLCGGEVVCVWGGGGGVRSSRPVQGAGVYG